MKKLLIAILLIYSVFLLGCPKGEKTYRTAKEASATMQIYSLNLIQANIDAFNAGEISLAHKDAIAKLTGRLVQGIDVYRRALAQTEDLLKTGKPLDGNTLATLNSIFDNEIVVPFFNVLNVTNLISGDKANLIKTIISSLRAAILTISDAFSQGRIYQQREALWI